MKKITTITTITVFLFIPFVATAVVQVDGYLRDGGTYVESHYRTEPDGIKYNNRSYDGPVGGPTKTTEFAEDHNQAIEECRNRKRSFRVRSGTMSNYQPNCGEKLNPKSYPSEEELYSSYSVSEDSEIDVMDSRNENSDSNEYTDFLDDIDSFGYNLIAKDNAADQLEYWLEGSSLYSEDRLQSHINKFADRDQSWGEVVRMLAEEGYLTDYNAESILGEMDHRDLSTLHREQSNYNEGSRQTNNKELKSRIDDLKSTVENISEQINTH
jgi:hypothetical protein